MSCYKATTAPLSQPFGCCGPGLKLRVAGAGVPEPGSGRQRCSPVCRTLARGCRCHAVVGARVALLRDAWAGRHSPKRAQVREAAAGSGASTAAARHVAPVQRSCAMLRGTRWAGGRSARPPSLCSPGQGEGMAPKGRSVPCPGHGWARQHGETHLHFHLHHHRHCHRHLPSRPIFCPALPSLLPLLADLSTLCLLEAPVCSFAVRTAALWSSSSLLEKTS